MLKKKDRLKLDLHLDNLNTNKVKKQQRDKIIAAEIYKMFSTIRDHQSSSAKAKGEMTMGGTANRRLVRKSGSWSYSSAKRHVIAKVMELPFAEDVDILARRVGLHTSDPMQQHEHDEKQSSNLADDFTNERVFIRIDDFLSKQVSTFLQRSYSVDYLNKDTDVRSRVKYVKIPNQTIRTQSMVSYDYASTCMPTLFGELRTAPYDLRYWSILKLLEEERQAGVIAHSQNRLMLSNGGDSTLNDACLLGYLDDAYLRDEASGYEDWQRSSAVIKEVLGINIISFIKKNCRLWRFSYL